MKADEQAMIGCLFPLIIFASICVLMIIFVIANEWIR